MFGLGCKEILVRLLQLHDPALAVFRKPVVCGLEGCQFPMSQGDFVPIFSFEYLE
jgi:hypothetical protein